MDFKEQELSFIYFNIIPSCLVERGHMQQGLNKCLLNLHCIKSNEYESKTFSET